MCAINIITIFFLFGHAVRRTIQKKSHLATVLYMCTTNIIIIFFFLNKFPWSHSLFSYHAYKFPYWIKFAFVAELHLVVVDNDLHDRFYLACERLDGVPDDVVDRLSNSCQIFVGILQLKDTAASKEVDRGMLYFIKFCDRMYTIISNTQSNLFHLPIFSLWEKWAFYTLISHMNFHDAVSVET